MAQIIYCDSQDCGQVADVLITYLQDGQSYAFCMAHYMGLITEMAEQFNTATQSQQGQEQEQQQAEETADKQQDKPRGTGRRGGQSAKQEGA